MCWVGETANNGWGWILLQIHCLFERKCELKYTATAHVFRA